MSETPHQYVMKDKQQRTFEYLDMLPSTAKPITHYKDENICLGYFYDEKTNRIIKTATTKAPHPYRYNRSHIITIKTISGTTMKIQESQLKMDFIHRVNESDN